MRPREYYNNGYKGEPSFSETVWVFLGIIIFFIAMVWPTQGYRLFDPQTDKEQLLEKKLNREMDKFAGSIYDQAFKQIRCGQYQPEDYFRDLKAIFVKARQFDQILPDNRLLGGFDGRWVRALANTYLFPRDLADFPREKVARLGGEFQNWRSEHYVKNQPPKKPFNIWSLISWLIVFYYRMMLLAFIFFIGQLVRLRKSLPKRTWKSPGTFFLSVLLWPMGIWCYPAEIGSVLLAEALFRQTTGNWFRLLTRREQKRIKKIAESIPIDNKDPIKFWRFVYRHGLLLAIILTIVLRSLSIFLATCLFSEKVVKDILKPRQNLTSVSWIRAGPTESIEQAETNSFFSIEALFLPEFLAQIILILYWLLRTQKVRKPTSRWKIIDHVPLTCRSLVSVF